MAISNHTIISRMLREIHVLQKNTSSETEFITRVENIKLMCELLLENEPEESMEKHARGDRPTVSDEEMMQMLQGKPEMTDEEYNVMIKGNNTPRTEKHVVKPKNTTHDTSSNHEGANGASIFDF